MQSTIDIKHLSRAEKLRVMEAIWEDLSREDGDIDKAKQRETMLED